MIYGCANCDKPLNKHNKSIRLVNYHGKVQIANFDSYQCYLDFWEGTPGFVPLKLYVDIK
jgi:hypothetical protein